MKLNFVIRIHATIEKGIRIDIGKLKIKQEVLQLVLNFVSISFDVQFPVLASIYFATPCKTEQILNPIVCTADLLTKTLAVTPTPSTVPNVLISEPLLTNKAKKTFAPIGTHDTSVELLEGTFASVRKGFYSFFICMMLLVFKNNKSQRTLKH